MADDENDDVRIREALARAKKIAKASNVNQYRRKEFLEVVPLKVESQIGTSFVHPTVQAWGPVFPQLQRAQNVQFQPIFKRKIAAFDRTKRSGQSGKIYPCVRYCLNFRLVVTFFTNLSFCLGVDSLATV